MPSPEHLQALGVGNYSIIQAQFSFEPCLHSTVYALVFWTIHPIFNSKTGVELNFPPNTLASSSLLMQKKKKREEEEELETLLHLWKIKNLAPSISNVDLRPQRFKCSFCLLCRKTQRSTSPSGLEQQIRGAGLIKYLFKEQICVSLETIGTIMIKPSVFGKDHCGH